MKDSKDSYKQKKWEAVVSEHKRMCDIVEKYSGCTPSYNPLLVYAAWSARSCLNKIIQSYAKITN